MIVVEVSLTYTIRELQRGRLVIKSFNGSFVVIILHDHSHVYVSLRCTNEMTDDGRRGKKKKAIIRTSYLGFRYLANVHGYYGTHGSASDALQYASHVEHARGLWKGDH